MYGTGADSVRPKKVTKNLKLTLLLDELESSDDDNGNDHVSCNASSPWMREYLRWFQTEEVVPDTMGIVEWWGVSKIFKI
jgi:hypothetical protein